MYSQTYFYWRSKFGRGDRLMEAWRRSGRYGDGIAGPGDYSANMEARRSFLRGLWRLSTRPSVTRLKI